MARLVEIFGGRPVPISFSDVVAALDDGRVLCAENNIPTYYSERHYEKAPFFSFDEHVAIPDIVLISEQTWSKLRPDIQRALAEAAAESSRYQRGIWELSEREAMDAMREAGVTFEYPSKQPFVDKAMPIYAEIGEERLRGYIERIRREGAPATAQTPAIDPAVSTASTEVSQAK
jgi:TRAP-type C4-dicarboxylate transport system substrate-binding protein